MRFYVTITTGRNSRPAKKGDDERIFIELSAFGKVIGEVELYEMSDENDKMDQYILTYRPNVRGVPIEDIDPIIIEEGHRNGEIVQRARG